MVCLLKLFVFVKAKSLNSLAAAAIRDASSSESSLKKLTSVGSHKAATPARTSHNTSTGDASNSTKKPSTNRNRLALMYEDEDDTTSIPKLEKIIEKDKERNRKEHEEQQKSKKKVEKKTESTTPSRDKHNKMEASASKFKAFLDIDENELDEQNDNNNKKAPRTPDVKKTDEVKTSCSNELRTPKAQKRLSTSMSDKNEQKSKRKKSLTPKKSNIQYKPFSRLLENVVLVISGIQNPDRADLRSKALQMGARYKPDWDSSCTHLM